jgi:WD40 repeat protein
MNTTLIYNFEERKLIHKITNPQKLLGASLMNRGLSKSKTLMKKKTQSLGNSGKSPTKKNSMNSKLEIPGSNDSPNPLGGSMNSPVINEQDRMASATNMTIIGSQIPNESMFQRESLVNMSYVDSPEEMTIIQALSIESQNDLLMTRSLLALGYANGDIIVINLKNMKKHRIKTSSRIEGMCFSEENNTIFVVNRNSNITIIDIENYSSFTKNMFKVQGAIYSVKCSPDQKHLYMAGAKGTIKQISLEDNAQTSDYGSISNGTIFSIEVTRNHKYLFAADSRGEIYRFIIQEHMLKPEKLNRNKTPEDLSPAEYLKPHDYDIRCMAITEDSETLFSADKEGNLLQWDVIDLTLVADYGDVSEGMIYSIALTSDDQYLFTSDDLGYVRQYSVKEKEMASMLGKLHHGEIYSICCSYDVNPKIDNNDLYSKYLFTSDNKGKLIQYDIDEGAIA